MPERLLASSRMSANESKMAGSLSLSGQEDDEIVACLKALTDGYTKVAAPGDASGASIGASPSAPLR